MSGDGQGRSGFWYLVNEVVTRDMIAGIKAIEVLLHARQLFFAVGGEWFFGFVLLATDALVFEAKQELFFCATLCGAALVGCHETPLFTALGPHARPKTPLFTTLWLHAEMCALQ